MTRPLALVQLPRTARGSLAAAFEGVGVEVELPSNSHQLSMLANSDTVVCAVLRDPIDRLQSYFNQRLRAGRPYQPEVWSDREATVFSVLRSFDALCEALTSDDVWLQSVAERMLVTLHPGYGSLHTMHQGSEARSIHVVGSFDDLPAAVARIAALADCPTPTLPTDPAIIDATPASLRCTLSPTAQAAIDRVMRDEVTLHRALLDNAD